MRAAVVMKQSHQWAALAVYTMTLFLSALLLFSLQPMFTRMVLPGFGGSSSVWAVSVFFYQTVLLLGYALAHLLAQRLSPFTSAMAQLALLLVAVIVLPIHLPGAWAEPPPDQNYLWLLAALCVGVGLPFLALSVNGPLLQAWFGTLGHDSSDDPYFLYAASNAGSLGALLAYPFLIEPLLTLQTQSSLWSGGYAATLVLIAVCGGFTAMAGRQPAEPASDSRPAVSGSPWPQRLLWAGLAFVPAGLVAAFTTFVTTDLASAPLFWTLPLALYLATFVLLFRRRTLISQRYLLMAQPVVVAATFVVLEWFGELSWLTGMIVGTLAYLLTCLIGHGQLYAARPGKERLTEFYLWISVGGAFGGLFAAILAPLLFTNIAEFHILLALGLFCRPDIRERLSAKGALPAALIALGLVALAAVCIASEVVPRRPENRFIALAICGAGLIAASYWPRAWLAAVTAIVTAWLILPRHYEPLYAVRTFHGAHRVVESPGGRYHLLFHGPTLHGIQNVMTADGKPADGRVPLTYYHPRGPLALGVRLARMARGGADQPLKVGIVGLGTGAMACHARASDEWRFFEIDPAVARIASHPELFSYLAKCRPGADIVLGDARLTLAREQPGSFDYLVIDAFSSDAIPVHLMTVEALELYVSLLSEKGVLALHISNLNLDLPPVVESNVAQLPGLAGIYLEGARGGGSLSSQVVLLSRDAGALAPALAWPEGRRLGPPAIHPWTDDYADVLSALVRGLRKRL